MLKKVSNYFNDKINSNSSKSHTSKKAIPVRVSPSSSTAKTANIAHPQTVYKHIVIYDVNIPKTVEEFADIVENPPHFNALLSNLKNPKCVKFLLATKECLDELLYNSHMKTPYEKYVEKCEIKVRLDMIYESEEKFKNVSDPMPTFNLSKNEIVEKLNELSELDSMINLALVNSKNSIL